MKWNTKESFLVTVDASSFVTPFRFLLPHRLLRLSGDEGRGMDDSELAKFLVHRLNRYVADYEKDESRRLLFTSCEVTGKVFTLEPGMVLVPLFQRVLFVDPRRDSRFFFDFDEHFLRVNRIRKIKRPKGKEQWCVEFIGSRVLFPVDWGIFKYFDPELRN